MSSSTQPTSPAGSDPLARSDAGAGRPGASGRDTGGKRGAGRGPDATRPRRAGRRALTIQRLAVAAVEEIRAVGYDELTVRNVARRAGVAPATAYIHFSSKDHLVAEAFWRLLQALPPADEALRGVRGREERVAAAIADVARLVTDEPAVAAAATVAVLANQPDVARIRRRIGASFHHRFAAALGDDADERVLDALDLAFYGAMVRAGVGELAYADLGSTMAAVAGALAGSGR